MGSLSAFKEPLNYPNTRRDESVVDDYHGVEIADPFRWLEDSDAKEVTEYVEKQIKLTDSVLEKCEAKDKLRDEVTKLIAHNPCYHVPVNSMSYMVEHYANAINGENLKQGNIYFLNTGLQVQSSGIPISRPFIDSRIAGRKRRRIDRCAKNGSFCKDSLKVEAEVLHDPHLLSEDETVEHYEETRKRENLKRGNKFFYFHNTGLQAQNVLYVQDSLTGKAEVLLDPNSLSEDGTVALSSFFVSTDAKYLAYALTSSGSDWVRIKVMQVEDNSAEPDTLSWVKFPCISWTHDSKGFFYSRYPAPKEGEDVDAGTETDSNLNHKLYYHFLSTDQSEDILCWTDTENPKHFLIGSVTYDGKYLLLSIQEGCDTVNKLYYCDMSSLPEGLEGFKKKNGPLPFVKLIDRFDAKYQAITNDDTVFTFRTNKDAPKYKLVRADLKEPNNWIDVIPEAEKDVLESAHAVNGICANKGWCQNSNVHCGQEEH